MSEATISARDQVLALKKGLNILAALNRCNGLSVSEISKRQTLPRPTVARIVQALQDAGYVYRCLADNKYRVTEKVRRLTCGFSTGQWLQKVSQPVADRLTARLGWPANVAHFEQGRVQLVCVTDTQSSMVVERVTIGLEVSLVSSALGISCLAFSSTEPIEDIIAGLISDASINNASHIEKLNDIEKIIVESRVRGYVIYGNGRFVAIAAPIFHDGKMIATIGIRIFLPLQAIAGKIEGMAAELLEAAADISMQLSDAMP